MIKKYLLLLPVFILAFFISGCEKEKKTVAQEPQKISVDFYTLKAQPYPIWIDFSGKTEAISNVEITSKVNGELKKVLFEAGAEVKVGDELFHIDDSSLKAILEQKVASKQKNEASLNLALANVKRYKPLVEKGLAPKEKLDELIATQKQLQAVVNADEASIQQAKIELEHTIIRSPINGQIGKSLLDVGNLVNASSTILAKVVDSKTLHVNFSPSAKQVSLIKKYKAQENPTVKITLDNSQDVQLQGSIDFIDNTTNEETGTVLMRAKIDNKDNLVFPGTFVKIKLFITDQIPLLALSPQSVGQNQLGAYVYTIDEKNTLQVKQLDIQYSNNDIVILKDGLKEGDKIVTSDITKLREGIVVEPKLVQNPIKL